MARIIALIEEPLSFLAYYGAALREQGHVVFTGETPSDVRSVLDEHVVPQVLICSAESWQNSVSLLMQMRHRIGRRVPAVVLCEDDVGRYQDMMFDADVIMLQLPVDVDLLERAIDDLIEAER